jgi:hypothetical protein
LHSGNWRSFIWTGSIKMKQSVNLLCKEFDPVAPTINAYIILSALLFEILGIVLYRNQLASELEFIESDYMQSQTDYDDRSISFEEQRDSFTPKLSNPKFAIDLVRLEFEIQGKKNVLKELQGNDLSTPVYSSQYLQAFSNLIIPGMWLTEINIHPTDKKVTLLGQTQQAKFVPQFIQSFAESGQLYELEFASLSLDRKKSADPAITFILSTDFVKIPEAVEIQKTANTNSEKVLANSKIDSTEPSSPPIPTAMLQAIGEK